MTGGKHSGGPSPGGKDQGGHGMTKSATVCATGCVHPLRVARTFC